MLRVDAGECTSWKLTSPFETHLLIDQIGRFQAVLQASAAAQQAQLAAARAQLQAGLAAAKDQVAAARQSLQGACSLPFKMTARHIAGAAGSSICDEPVSMLCAIRCCSDVLLGFCKRSSAFLGSQVSGRPQLHAAAPARRRRAETWM